MDILQSLDPGLLPLLGVGCALLCVAGVVLMLGAQVIGIFADLIGSVTGLFSGLVGNPIACCGCLVLLGAVVVCGGGLWVISGVLSSCGTPEAVNFCALFGR
ncbi:MAG: hypothetical protein SF162_14785 [bacterium]|nr:hypothetical protein [bacterium]